MQTYFVRVECDVTAKVYSQPFRYRAYINNELFAERTWIWTDSYLEENFQINAPPGVYSIRFETVDINNGKIKVSNYKTHWPFIDLLKNNITKLKIELVQFIQSNAQPYGHSDLSYFYDPIQKDQETITAMINCIASEEEKLAWYVQRRPCIIDHLGQTAVEILDASI